ncbi:hypothetical protein BABINDRAFT_35812 [Babjeviella inositovora NRRL Y-12698]|uniref:Structure-specific endonuclease subunit SLX4 n=1 Tax=Babjeviella inositovora NRRL Y-12698 TaxID=984486 RepID=A0A1E3QR02_9ASCO|nr:uncharacterized protein BABINDRAFT_35812 [Babjeviella inositovora NRRL Y-12698]ODQ80119.1 hypothetical protein BABINDRAFT_35812 [Babjeviella inositovora NRRL Y-12698]
MSGTSKPITIDTAPPDDFSSMTTKALKEKLKEWGLKPMQSRDKIIDVLNHTRKLLNHEHLSQISQKAVRTQIYNKISGMLLADTKFFERVISFEPIKIDELRGYLQTQGVTVAEDIVRGFCDRNGICYTGFDDSAEEKE